MVSSVSEEAQKGQQRLSQIEEGSQSKYVCLLSSWYQVSTAHEYTIPELVISMKNKRRIRLETCGEVWVLVIFFQNLRASETLNH